MKGFDEAVANYPGNVMYSEEVFDAERISNFILKLSSTSFGMLSVEHIAFGDNLLDYFLASDDPQYALLGGKSELIFALSLYCSLLPKSDGIEGHLLICNKICSDKSLILSEAVYNDLEKGRAGILVALTFLYTVRADDRIEELISGLLLLLISDARFYKKSITWFRSDLLPNQEKSSRDNSDMIFALHYVKSVFKNDFLSMLLSSIFVGSSGVLRSRSREVAAYEKRITWFSALQNLTRLFNHTQGNNSLAGLTRQNGFSVLLRDNFPEFVKDISADVLEQVIARLAQSCEDLNQYEMLKMLKEMNPKVDRSRFSIQLRRLRLRVRIIDRSGIFTGDGCINAAYYTNCKLLAEMPQDALFAINFSINQNGVFYQMVNSNWLYSYQYEKKRFVGCFSVNRYDKSIFMNIELLDGFLPRLFMYLSERSASIRDFKRDQLDRLNLEFNEEHFKNRLLLLVRQGILTPNFGT